MTPAIVVIAYNRPRSLERLLGSLLKGQYPPQGVPLIISLDRCEDEAVTQAIDHVLAQFVWPFGPLTVVRHPRKLGLRQHILHCGGYAEQHDGIVMLEDDLYVSPHFYRYALDALRYYGGDPAIAGISLYNLSINETAIHPFEPIDDGSDVYFLQLPSSWGQAWSSRQWHEFLRWHAQNPSHETGKHLLPVNILGWPQESSWKRRFAQYLVSEDRYFVYPRSSLTTNFGEPGTNYHQPTHRLQVNPLWGDKEFRFQPFDGALARYDAFCELLPASLAQLEPRFCELDLTVDLHGTKDPATMTTRYVLTSQPCEEWLLGFCLGPKPPELSIAFGLPGEAFKLCEVKAIQPQNKGRHSNVLCQYHYDATILSKRHAMSYLFNQATGMLQERLGQIAAKRPLWRFGMARE